MSLVDFAIEKINYVSDDIPGMRPGQCIASLAASLAVKRQSSNSVVLLSSVQLLLANMKDTPDQSVGLVLAALSSKKTLLQFAKDILEKSGGIRQTIKNEWANQQELDRSVENWEALRDESVQKLLDNAPASLQDFVSAERQSWELMLLFSKTDATACPLMQTLEEYLELLDCASFLQMRNQALPQPPPILIQPPPGIGAWSRVDGRLLPSQSQNMQILYSALDRSGVEVAEEVASIHDTENADALFIKTACSTYENLSDARKPMFPAGVNCTLMVSSAQFWQKRVGTRTLFPVTANSFPSAYKVLAIARNYGDEKRFYVYVVWQPLLLVGGGAPLLRHFKYKPGDRLLKGLFSPFEVDIEASGIDRNQLDAVNGQIVWKEFDDGNGHNFQRLLFQDSWVNYNSRCMAKHTVFAVSSLPANLLSVHDVLVTRVFVFLADP
jgi:hypothetical protein